MARSVWGECSSYFWKWWKYHDNTSYSNNITYVCWAATWWQVFTPIIHTHFFFPTFIFIVRSRGKHEFHLRADRLRLWKVWAIARGHLARRRVQPVDPRFAISLSLQAWFQAPPSQWSSPQSLGRTSCASYLCLPSCVAPPCLRVPEAGLWVNVVQEGESTRARAWWRAWTLIGCHHFLHLESRPNWVLSSSHTEAT